MNIYKTSTTLLKCIRQARAINFYRIEINHAFPSASNLCRRISLATNKCTETTTNAAVSELECTSKYTEYLRKVRSVDEIDVKRMLEGDNLTSLNQARRSLLLQFCGKALCNKPIEFRKGLCEKIWAEFSPEVLDVTDYNTYLQVCTENEVPVDREQFVASMKCEPNKETFQLLLENSCVRDDLEAAVKILVAMKEKEFPVDEEIFNLLVLGHTINSGLQGGEGVLATMRSAKMPETSNTYWHFLLGLAKRDSGKEFFDALKSPLLQFEPHLFFEVLLALGMNNKHMWLLEMKRRFDFESLPRNLHGDLEHVCLDLLYRGKAEVAVEIYCDLVESNGEIGFARFLLEEMFSVNPDVKSIKHIVQYLASSGKNPLALEEVTELALRNRHVNTALELFADFKVLRPHYFWPVFLHASNERGEIGIISTLRTMLALNVPIDGDTLELYCLPHCDLSNPKRFLNRLEGLGFTMRQMLSPMLVTLLRNGGIKVAGELCQEFKLSETTPRLPKTLASAFHDTKAATDAVIILRSIRECASTSTDTVGTILLDVVRLCKEDEDFLQFLKLTRILKKEKMFISSASAEKLSRDLINCPAEHKSSLLDVIDDLLDISMREDAGAIKHPRNMSIEELECHFIELSGKNMETRGVLRRLMQEHSRLGNYKRLQELREAFTKSGYEESPGMQAGLLKGYIQKGNLEEAIDTFNHLKTHHPSFRIDEYKVLDLATLMVNADMFDEAIDLLSEYRKDNELRNSSANERNCWRLVGAAKNPDQARKLSVLLTGDGYCAAKNTILGPVVRAYLKCGDIEGAIAFYSDCASKYSCTPLQKELMDAALDAESGDFLQKIVKVTVNVHGEISTKLTLIVALAEKGMTKPLHKLITEMKYIPKPKLQRQYQRWIQQDKLAPLEVLSDAACRVPNILDLNTLHMAIMQMHSKRNDCDGALAFVKKLQEDEVVVTKEVKKELDALLNRSKLIFPIQTSASNVT